MPVMVRLTKEAATSSSVGNSRRGNTPAQATISQIPPTTTKGKILRAISRRRSPPCEGADGSATLIVTASCIGERLSSRAPHAWLLCGLLTKDTALNAYHKHWGFRARKHHWRNCGGPAKARQDFNGRL